MYKILLFIFLGIMISWCTSNQQPDVIWVDYESAEENGWWGWGIPSWEQWSR